MTEAPPSTLGRTVGLAVLAFVVGFLALSVGLGQLRFLWAAYHHGGL